VFCGTQFEASDEFLIEVADNQLGHETMPLISSLSMLTANTCQPTTVELGNPPIKIEAGFVDRRA
jgi:hypothetical protein